MARLKPVQQLRPQALPIKLLAIATFTGFANMPSGIARAHVAKFSPEWFLAVHATIPFIAMLRKAVLMPKWAIAFTIAAAVIGQVMGARYERTRLAGSLSSHPLLPLPHGRESRADERTTGHRFGAGACGTAAAAQAREGAWRQTYMVPRIC